MGRASLMGLPAILLAISGTTVALYLPTFYGLDMGLGLATVGLVFALARAVDIMIDPLMGYISDRTRSRFGPRLPWIAFAIWPLLIGLYLLTHPPENVGVIYLAIAILMHYVAWTMLDIPFASIALETGKSPVERVRLSSGVAICQLIGVLLIAAVPTILGRTTSEAVPLIPWVFAGIALLALPVFLRHAPRPSQPPRHEFGILTAYRAVLSRPPVRRIVFAFMMTMAGNAFVSAQIVLYVDFRVEADIGAAPFFLIGFLASGIALPIVLFCARRFGRIKTWQGSLLISMLGLMFIATGQIIPFTIGMVLFGATLAADAVIPNALLADDIARAEAEGSPPLAGKIRAFKNGLQKMTTFGPMLIGLPLLDWAGVEQGGARTPVMQGMLLLSVVGIPIALKCIALNASRRIT